LQIENAASLRNVENVTTKRFLISTTVHVCETPLAKYEIKQNPKAWTSRRKTYGKIEK